MSLKIPQISPSVIRDLDTALSNWRDLIPEDKAANLNEETLIQLLKDRKRAEIYRIIADKRNAMFKEMYTSEDKSVLELTKEFGVFSYEQTAKWWDIENKLNSIILKFRARGKIEDIKKLKPALNTLTQKIIETFNEQEKIMNSNMTIIMNNNINTISGGNSDIIKELNDLFSTQTPKFQQDNKEILNDYKGFINDSAAGLIKDKISKIEQGELSPDSLKRSDLFTDEEMINIELKKTQIAEKIVNRRRKLNSDSFEDVVLRSTGISGKEKFLETIKEFPEDLISDEVKKVIEESINSDFILPSNKEKEESKNKRSIPLAVSITATIASVMLSTAATYLKRLPQQEIEGRWKKNFFYKWCNNGSYTFIKYAFTHCFNGTIVSHLLDIMEQQKLDIDYNGIANCLAFMANVIDISTIFAGKKSFEILLETTEFSINLLLSDFCKNRIKENNENDGSIYLCDLLIGVLNISKKALIK